MGMSSVTGIAKSYCATLKNQRTKKVNFGAVAVQVLFPLAVGVVWVFFGPTITNPGNAIAGISIVSALLCSMATMLFQIRIDIRSDMESGENHFITEKDATLIDELFAAVAWAILFGLTTVLIMVFSDWLGILQLCNIAPKIISGVIVAFIAHFVFVIGTVLKRLARVYDLVARNKRRTS